MSHEAAMISKIYSVDESEIFPFQPREKFVRHGDYVGDVKIDPDNILDKVWKNKFFELCEEFSDIIQYSPGTYNGRYGFVKNSIEFTSLPPPNNRCYVPKYSKEMMDQLANKMDELMEDGILRRSESLRCSPVHPCWFPNLMAGGAMSQT